VKTIGSHLMLNLAVLGPLQNLGLTDVGAWYDTGVDGNPIGCESQGGQ
jgi:hypothetical protein